ncbi:O-methyltransferase fsr2 [Fusarium oxysporum f. sp. albedinis]|nr:O-methyltransferase fsr2 [Fusarium oxysporum f. sp. albedinis]
MWLQKAAVRLVSDDPGMSTVLFNPTELMRIAGSLAKDRLTSANVCVKCAHKSFGALRRVPWPTNPAFTDSRHTFLFWDKLVGISVFHNQDAKTAGSNFELPRGGFSPLAQSSQRQQRPIQNACVHTLSQS